MAELQQMRNELSTALENAGVLVESLEIAVADHDVVEAKARLLRDPLLLPHTPELPSHRRSDLMVRGTIESSDSGRLVYWGQHTFSVERDHSFFAPVPAEYGSEVAISFGWEFDAETLEPSFADVRERESVHYASVLPGNEMKLFVQCFADAFKKLASTERG